MGIFLRPAAFGVMIFLLGIGATKIYRVYVAYSAAIRVQAFMGKTGSDLEAKWREVLDLNGTPRIKSIDTKAMVELGKINMERGNFKQASNYYAKILADQAFNFGANLGVAEIAFSKKEWRKAREAYRRIIYLRPQEVRFYPFYIHAAIGDGKVDEAMEFISKIEEPHPIPLYEPEDYLTIGNALFRKKRLQEAIAYLQKGKQSMSQNYKSYLLLGRAYCESGQYTNGYKVLEAAVRLNPDIPEGYYYLGIGYERTHQYQKAITAFEKLVSIDNKDIKGLYHLKRLYKKMGLGNKAIEMGNLIEGIATKVIEAADWKGRSGKNVFRNGDMYWKGTVSAPLFLKEGEVKFILQARGAPAREIWPHMVVKLDVEVIGEVDVTSTKLKDYEFKKAVKSGKYQLSVSFTNDGGTLDKNGKLIEDRNLFVRRCGIVYEE
jgi:tetratricopeptide (TPR) repeat protein